MITNEQRQQIKDLIDKLTDNASIFILAEDNSKIERVLFNYDIRLLVNQLSFESYVLNKLVYEKTEIQFKNEAQTKELKLENK